MEAAVQELDALCGTCIVCNAIEDNMNRYLHTFFHLYQNDSEFRKHFAQSKGVCLPHAVQLLNSRRRSCQAANYPPLPTSSAIWKPKHSTAFRAT